MELILLEEKEALMSYFDKKNVEKNLILEKIKLISKLMNLDQKK